MDCLRPLLEKGEHRIGEVPGLSAYSAVWMEGARSRQGRTEVASRATRQNATAAIP
jgi:hypothetical protein